MHILESFTLGKDNHPQTCEDGLFISEKLVAVIDGATTDSNRLWNGQKSGCFAKEVLLRSLQELVEGTGSDILTEEGWAILVLERLDTALYETMRKLGQADVSPEEYPRASIIIYNNIRKEIVNYGDCQCKIGDVVHSHVKMIDQLNADLRAFYLEYYLQQGMTLEELAEEDLGRAAITRNLAMQCSFENCPGAFGYPVLNGRGINLSLMKVFKVAQGDEVILATDGYPRLGTSLEESEGALQQLLKEDPMCFRSYRSTKGVRAGNVSFDDRAFCRFRV